MRAILNKSWWQHPTIHQLYGHLPPITKTIQVRRTRHAGHGWRSKDELIRDVLLWTPTHGRAKAGWPARTYIQQLCEDTGCCPEDLPRVMNDREEWRERVGDISANSATWWWWWWCRWSAKQTILLCVLARNQTKCLDSRSRRDRKKEGNASQRVGRRNSEKAVGNGRRRVAVWSRHRSRRDQSAWERVQSQWGKTSQDGL